MECKGNDNMVKFLILVLAVGLFYAATAPSAWAQVTVEYGVIGSKTPPKSADITGNIGNKAEIGSQPTACSSKACRSKQTNKSTTAQKIKEPRIVEKRAGQRSTGTGPLIIEKRGDHYERVN
jgi:hypothetical protein